MSMIAAMIIAQFDSIFKEGFLKPHGQLVCLIPVQSRVHWLNDPCAAANAVSRGHVPLVFYRRGLRKDFSFVCPELQIRIVIARPLVISLDNYQGTSSSTDGCFRLSSFNL